VTARHSTLAVRLHPAGATPIALGRQYRNARTSESPLLLVRTVPEEPAAIDPGTLPISLRGTAAEIAVAWTEAQLAADATLLGLGVGLRVVLVPGAGRWYADLMVIRTGGRLRSGRGRQDPRSALEAARQSLLASIDSCHRAEPDAT
jgi:hypothetical protein